MWQSLIRLIESGVAGPPNKLFMAFFVGGSQKRHHDLYLLEMQNAKKSMAIKKKIALMSRLGVVRANVTHTGLKIMCSSLCTYGVFFLNYGV